VQDFGHRSALMYAAWYGEVECVRILAKRGAKI